MKFQSWMVLAVCLVAPAMASLLRKFAPGQPASMEILGVFAVLAGFVWLMSQPRRAPAWLMVPLLVWAYFQLLYAALAIGTDWRIAVVATLVRIVPILMAPIAYAAILGVEDFRRASMPAAVLGALMVPVGLVVAFLGNDALPMFLQPIQQLIELGRAGRSGVPAVSGVFSTFAVLAMSMLAIFYLCMANIALAEEQGRKTTMWWMFAISALLLVFLSTRRGSFMAALVGLAVYVYYRRRIPLRLLIPAFVGVIVVLAIEAWGQFAGGTADADGRAALLLEAFSSREILLRIFGVLLPLMWMWIQLTPYGTFLGFAGPEGSAFMGEGSSQFSTDLVEVGGAQLLAEMGFLGVLLMPLIVLLVMWRLHRRSRGMFCRRAVLLLISFQGTFFALYYLKELTSMTVVSMAQLFFWGSSGMAAALIDREQRERGYWRSILKEHFERNALAGHAEES